MALQLTIEILYLDSPAIIDCDTLPTSMNGIEHGVGCPGAVWMDGKPSKEYCVNDARYPWWSNCCTWYAGNCLPNTAIPKTVIETANRIDAEQYPISFEKHSYNFISYKSGIVILCVFCITILVSHWRCHLIWAIIFFIVKSFNLFSYTKGHNKEKNRNVDPTEAWEKAKKCWDSADGKKCF